MIDDFCRARLDCYAFSVLQSGYIIYIYIYILQLQITCQLVFYFVLEQGKMAEVCDVFYVIQ